MMAEILREITVVKNDYEITSEQVLSWAKKWEPQGAQKAIFEKTEQIRNLK